MKRHGWRYAIISRRPILIASIIFPSRATSCFQGDEPASLRIETLYHRLIAEPEQGRDALRQLYSQWNSADQHEALRSLGRCP